MRPRQPGADPTLTLIHASMLGGTLLFFGVVVFFFGGRATGTTDGIFRWAWLGFAALAVFGVGALRGRLHRDSDAAEIRTTGILIWALAESAALIGLVSTILTGNVTPAIGATMIGVFLMLHHRPSQLG